MRSKMMELSACLMVGVLCFAVPVYAQIEDSDEEQEINNNAARAVTVYSIPERRQGRMATAMRDTTAEANSLVNSVIAPNVFDAPGGHNAARKAVRVSRPSLRGRGNVALSSAAEKTIPLPKEIDPMPFADGTQCEKVSLRWKKLAKFSQ